MIDTRKIRVDVPEGKSGNWRVERFTVDPKGASFHNLREMINGRGRGIEEGEYTKLMRGNTLVMSDVPAEIAEYVDLYNVSPEDFKFFRREIDFTTILAEMDL